MKYRLLSKTKNTRLIGFFLTCSLSVLGSQPVTAQAEEELLVLEEVIVTALRKEESLQDVAGAVTAFSSGAIERMHIVSVEDIALKTPNFTMSAFIKNCRPRAW